MRHSAFAEKFRQYLAYRRQLFFAKIHSLKHRGVRTQFGILSRQDTESSHKCFQELKKRTNDGDHKGGHDNSMALKLFGVGVLLTPFYRSCSPLYKLLKAESSFHYIRAALSESGFDDIFGGIFNQFWATKVGQLPNVPAGAFPPC